MNRKILLCIFSLAASAMALADNYPSSGYYRIQNKYPSTQRYLTMVDSYGSVNLQSVTADLGAIVTVKGVDGIGNVVSDPSSIMYVERVSATSTQYSFHCQGISTKDLMDYYLTLTAVGDGSFLASASTSGITKYLYDAERDMDSPVPEDNGCLALYNGSTLQNKRLHWYPRPIDTNNNYIGLNPEKIGDAYYTTFYAGFPFDFASSGMSAYYVKTVDKQKAMAILEPVSGKIPGSCPVIIKSAKGGTENNKLNPQPPFSGNFNGNLLIGVFFCNDVKESTKHRNVVNYDAKTMRVLGKMADGSLGFITATNIKYIPANTAYLKVDADAPAQIKLVTAEEYNTVQNVTVTAKNYTRVYGDANPAFEYTASSGLTGTPAITCSATATSPVGTYPIVVGQGTVSGYTVSGVNGTLTITAAPLTVKAADATRVEGTDNPAFTLTYEGFKNGESEAVLTTKPTATTTATKDSPVGTYPITVSGGAASNYTLNYVAGTLTVTEEKVTVKAKSYTRVYGDTNPTFAYETEGGKIKGGEPTLTCEATANSPVGKYAIKVAKGSMTNGAVEFVEGTLTIEEAPLTVKANDATRVQGEENPAFTLTYEGFKNGETEEVLTQKPTATTTATVDSPAGTYPITVNGGQAQNYKLNYVEGKLTVTALQLTVIAKSYSREYGDANPTFDYEIVGGQATGKPEITCTADATSPVSTYTIKVSKGTMTNAEINFIDGELTITPALLTVRVSDASRHVGEENPEFTLSYQGFKNNETEEVLTEKPTASTTATSDSPVGYYDIEIHGGEASNYVFAYEPGTLTVLPVSKTFVTQTEEGSTAAVYMISDDGLSVTYLEVASDTATVVIIPAEVTYEGITYQVTAIAPEAFKGKTAIREVKIPASIHEIGNYAFANCISLSSVTVLSNVILLMDAKQLTALFDNVKLSSCTLYVPYGTSGDYENSAAKNLFGSIIELEDTSISGISDANRNRGAVYTINGTRANGSNLKKGIYIIDGKKVVVK